MAATKGTNSYVSLADADAYFDNKLDVAAWTDASTTQKEQALVTATRTLDTLPWLGTVRDESQTLAFPREGSYVDPARGSIIYFGTTPPQRILDATCELAYHLLNNDGLLDDVGTVDAVSIGSISITNIKRARLLPTSVFYLVKPLRTFGRQVWRAW